MSTIFQVKLLLNLAAEKAGIESGSLIIEQSDLDPGYQVGDSFQVTKKVGKQGFSLTDAYNQTFTFSVTVLERQDNKDSDPQIVEIIVESPERETILAYANALKDRNPKIFGGSE